MLPLLRDAMGVAITSAHVTAVTIARGWRRRIADQQRLTFDSTRGERIWHPAAIALQTLMPAVEHRSADVTVTLSNRFVRYVVVPWHDQLTNAEIEVAFARHCFREIYGDVVQNWEVRVSPAPAGQPRIASAVDLELLSGIREVFADSKLRIRSIQPHLMSAYNKWRHKLDRRGCLFVVAEEQFYTCMVLLRRSWCSVHSGMFSWPLSQALPIILDREFVRCGIEERPPVFLYAPEQTSVTFAGDASWSSSCLQLTDEAGLAASLDPIYRTAVMAI